MKVGSVSRNVIAIDFRCDGRVLASVIDVKRGLSDALAAQLIAMAYNCKSAAEIAIVITDDGKATSVKSNHDVAKMLSRVTKRPVVYVDVPENIARQAMLQLGMPASLVEGLLVQNLMDERDGNRSFADC